MNYENSIKIKNLPEYERPRERLLRYGVSSLSDSELLAIIISSGTKNDSAINLASRVLSMDSSGLSFFAHCMPEELCKLPGIGEAIACRITAAIEFGRRVHNAPTSICSLNSPSVVARICSDMENKTQEIVRVLMINTKCQLIMSEDVCMGGISSCSASPREVFCSAIKKGAYGIILVHNHPSGDPMPSGDDEHVTEKIRDAGNLLNIRLLDHIIIGKNNFYSFKEQNSILG